MKHNGTEEMAFKMTTFARLLVISMRYNNS